MVESGDVERVHIERMATGGEAVAHLSEGRVVFVTGALPGEVVDVRIERIKKRWARATTLAVIESSPDRAPLLCDHALAGECGGCDWLHVAPAAARTHKLGIVTEQLARLGGLDAPQVGQALRRNIKVLHCFGLVKRDQPVFIEIDTRPNQGIDKALVGDVDNLARRR